MLTVVLAALSAAAVIVVGLRLYMGRVAEDQLRPGEDVAIAALRGPLAANAFLACPPGYCAVAEAAASPVFAGSADRLAEYSPPIIAAAPRRVRLPARPPVRRSGLIHRSAVLRLPGPRSTRT